MTDPIHYYIRQGGRDVQGPFPKERIRALVRSGKAQPAMEFSTDGQNWILGSQVPGLFDGAGAASHGPKRRPELDGNGRAASRRPVVPAKLVLPALAAIAIVGAVTWGLMAGGSKISAKTSAKTAAKTRDGAEGHATGVGSPSDEASPEQQLQSAAAEGDPDAALELARLYDTRDSVPKDDARVLQWYRQAGEQGRVAAQVILGQRYADGRGAPQDDVEATRWFRKAAEAGDPSGQNHLGHMYEVGRGVPADPAEAREWYRLAAAQGHALAQARLDELQAQPPGPALSEEHKGSMVEDAAEFARVRKAAEGGDEHASLLLEMVNARATAKAQGKAVELEVLVTRATTHLNGEGGPSDESAAARWFHLAAMEGHADAWRQLGELYGLGTGVPRDQGEMLRCFLSAGNYGSAIACIQLSIAYSQGDSVPLDKGEAAKWVNKAISIWRKAAEEGDVDAAVSLGNTYEKGHNPREMPDVPPKDLTEALRWYRTAAELGDAGAQHSVGVMYTNGRGVAKDHHEAVKWFRLGVEQGDARSQASLGLMYLRGDGVAPDDAAAVGWFHKAAAQGNATGQSCLGYAYADGRGVQKDIDEALRWFRLAAAQGDRTAQHNADVLEARRRRDGAPTARTLVSEPEFRAWKTLQDERELFDLWTRKGKVPPDFIAKLRGKKYDEMAIIWAALRGTGKHIPLTAAHRRLFKKQVAKIDERSAELVKALEEKGHSLPASMR